MSKSVLTIAAVVGVAFGLSAAALHPAGAAEVRPPIATSAEPEKVSVLDAGDFFSVQARNATVAEVLEVLKTRLKLTFVNTDRIDMARTVDGTRVGNIQHIMAWLVPNDGFVVFYEEEKPGKPGRPERIGFLQGGTPTAGLPSPDGAGGKAAAPTDAAKNPKGGQQASAGAGAGAGGSATDSAATKAGKPDVADTGGRHENLTVPEQLAAATNYAQLEIERQANDPTGQSPAPGYQNGPGNVANTTLEQQMQRSQALATTQLEALQNAFRAACRGGINGPC